jgi:hypothetical protein
MNRLGAKQWGTVDVVHLLGDDLVMSWTQIKHPIDEVGEQQ